MRLRQAKTHTFRSWKHIRDDSVICVAKYNCYMTKMQVLKVYMHFLRYFATILLFSRKIKLEISFEKITHVYVPSYESFLIKRL